jgi:hypothetical protein
MSNKAKNIRLIGKIIQEHGEFSLGEVQPSSSPSIQSRGNLTDLVDYVMEDAVKIEVWDERRGEPIDSYSLNYNELSEEVVEEIVELCRTWEELNTEEDED